MYIYPVLLDKSTRAVRTIWFAGTLGARVLTGLSTVKREGLSGSNLDVRPHDLTGSMQY